MNLLNANQSFEKYYYVSWLAGEKISHWILKIKIYQSRLSFLIFVFVVGEEDGVVYMQNVIQVCVQSSRLYIIWARSLIYLSWVSGHVWSYIMDQRYSLLALGALRNGLILFSLHSNFVSYFTGCYWNCYLTIQPTLFSWNKTLSNQLVTIRQIIKQKIKYLYNFLFSYKWWTVSDSV